VTAGVYAIVNAVDGTAYIGSSADIPSRWARHRRLLRRGRSHNSRLATDWQRLGSSAFEFRVLEYTQGSERERLCAEQRWLDDPRWPATYNRLPPAPAAQPLHAIKVEMHTRDIAYLDGLASEWGCSRSAAFRRIIREHRKGATA
jgi:group I intron endonuclease